MLLATALGQTKGPDIPAGVRDRIDSIASDVEALRQRVQSLQGLVSPRPEAVDRVSVLHGYVMVFVIAFVVTLLATPLVRRLALAHGVIDRPSEARKIHRMPVAYLGGVAVYLGLMAGILYSYLATVMPGLLDFHPTQYLDPETGDHFTVPLSIAFGLTLIMMLGLIDDVMGIAPRLKVGGQLVAAAALAATDVGVKVAAGVVVPLAKTIGLQTKIIGVSETVRYDIPLPVHILGVDSIPIDLVYWTGTAVIAVFVLGACNASNLIDGLDGLLSGTTAIASLGLLVIALGMAAADDGPRDGPRIILCLALLGACLGFLPHNFNPATIFLGDAGSLLLGFNTIVIILMLGDQGQTKLVVAGLIIYAIPIIDTVLAIVRRKLAGRAISDADDQHLHHMLKRALGVKGAVFALYGIGVAFALLGIALSIGRARVIYPIALVLAAFVGITAIKIARRKQMEEQALSYANGRRPGRARNAPRPELELETERVAPD